MTTAQPENQEKDGLTNFSPPKIDPETGKPTQRVITDAKQAYAIAESWWQRANQGASGNGEGRISVAATIALKYGGEAPFTPRDLDRNGAGWRNNFSTGWLGSIVDRVKPQMTDPLNKATTLTHSSLPEAFERANEKSRKFGTVTTNLIRRWPEWKNFISSVAQENVLFGFAVPGWTDEDWRPKLWRFDEVYAPDGTGQHAQKVSSIVFVQRMPIHEFIDILSDKKAAQAAGYNFENCCKIADNSATRTAAPKQPTGLQLADSQRELNPFQFGMENQARTVNMYHVLARDYTGEVDLWTVNMEDGMEIRNREALHDQMEDACCLFTLQTGNEKLFGSKGLGRALCNLHIAIERNRCLGADQMLLAGLVILQGDAKNTPALQAKVKHPFIILPDGMKVVSERIEFDFNAFQMMDDKLNAIGESIAGAFIPPNLDQDNGANTKIEAAQRAQREDAVKDGVLGRFFDHVSDLVSAMQRKIYSPVAIREGKRVFDAKQAKKVKGIRLIARKVWKILERAFGSSKEKDLKGIEPIQDSPVADEESVNAVVELLEAGLSPEEIATLAITPANSNSEEPAGDNKDEKTLAYIAANRASPYVNQKAASKMEANILIGEDAAGQLLTDTEDPNEQAIAVRGQIMEFSEMMAGNAMPVAGSDNHELHRKVLAGKLEGIMMGVTQAPTDALCRTAQLSISHYVEHLNADAITPNEQKQSEMQKMKEWWGALQKTGEAMEQQRQALLASGGNPDGNPLATGPDALPVGPNGIPQAGPDGQVTGEDPNQRGALADLALKVGDQKLREKELSLKEQDQTHRHAMDDLKMQSSGVDQAHKIASDVIAQADKEKDRTAALNQPA